ncbi:MAG: hypothetical protein ACKOXF_03180, partial [Chitinophagaceae bacterium]
MWALDDKADYISLISEEQRRFANWQVTGANISQAVSEQSPFKNSVTNRVTAGISDTGFKQITCISNDLVNFSELSSSLKTFSVGAYLYSFTAAISSFEIGYEYNDPSTGNVVQDLKYFETPINNNWVFLSET